ncbi:unnamed protein product, partial [Darwinula stevensoni]
GNAGFDAQETLVKLEEELDSNMESVGVDLESGGALIPSQVGIYDNYCVKKHQINSATVIASNLLLVDEVMRAGLSSLK